MKLITAATTLASAAAAGVTIESDFYLYEEAFEANAIDVAAFTWQPVFAWDSHNEQIDLCERVWLTDDADTVDGAVGSNTFAACCTPSDREAMIDGCENVLASQGWSSDDIPTACDVSDDAVCGDVDTSFVADWHVEYDACDFSYNCAETQMFDVVYRDTVPPEIGCEEDANGDNCEWGGDDYIHEKCIYWEGLEISAFDEVSLGVEAEFSVTYGGSISEGTYCSTVGAIGNSQQYCSGGTEQSGEGSNPTDYIDNSVLGTYCIEYNAWDTAGNKAKPETFIIVIEDNTDPSLELDSYSGSVECGVDTSVPDAGEACNNLPCSDEPEVEWEFCEGSDYCAYDDNVDFGNEGSYSLTYSCQDEVNYVSTEYALTVEDTTAPFITCPSDVEMHVFWTIDDYLGDASCSDYCDEGPTCVDDRETSIENDDGVTNTIGTYTTTFTAGDAAGWETSCEVTTVVYDETEPVCDFVDCGDEVTYVEACTGEYVEEGIYCEDDYDADISSKIVTSGSVDTWELGTYLITYDACDQSDNCAETVTRTVIVQDTVDPVLTVGYTATYGDESSAYYKSTVVMEASDFGPYGIYDSCEDTCDACASHPDAGVETYSVSVGSIAYEKYATAAGAGEAYDVLEIVADDQDYYCGADFETLEKNAASVESTLDYDALAGVCGFYTLDFYCEDWAGNTDTGVLYVVTVDTISPVIYYGEYFAQAAATNGAAMFVGGCALVTALVALVVKRSARTGYEQIPV